MRLLHAVTADPGTTASAVGDPNGARLLRLRQEGLVWAGGQNPLRYYPTDAGADLIARTQAPAVIAGVQRIRAAALAVSEPAPLMLCPPRRPLPHTFTSFAQALRARIGSNLLISNESASGTSITAIGTLAKVEEEHEGDDTRLIAVVDDTAFVEFSRRHYEHALEDGTGELQVRQGGHTTRIWQDR
jgi:hypothetical protein